MSVKILVTGGAGFIGSSIVRHIIDETDYSVINVDKLTYAGNLEALKTVEGSQRYSFELVDICDAVELKRVFNQYKPDLVIHLAAESHVDRSIYGPSDFIQSNIVGTFTLLEEARAYWSLLESERKLRFRFYHVSTDEVYGDLPHPDEVRRSSMIRGQLFNEDQSLQLFTERTAYAPSSPYSASKAASDHLVRAWFRTYGLPTLITNCSNNYGPYQFPEKLIPVTILNALEGKPIPVYGKGNQIRDWLYVEDHARALVLVAMQGTVGETYNIGGHNEKKNIEVVKTICKVLDEFMPCGHGVLNINRQVSEVIDASIQGYGSLITFVKDRPGHDLRYAIDASKIQKELGWMPQETFESGIRKTVRWYLDNKEWCQRMKDGFY